MTLLVAASPCALALGTPSAILAGIAQAARNGVLIKGGAHLENLGRLKAIAFDKTGTITQGQPEMTDLIPLGSLSAERVLALAAAVESRSAHPLAQAVLRAAQAQQLEIPARRRRFSRHRARHPGPGRRAAGQGRQRPPVRSRRGRPARTAPSGRPKPWKTRARPSCSSPWTALPPA